MSRLEDRQVDAHDLALVLDGLELLALTLWRIMPGDDSFETPIAEVDALIEQIRSKYDISSSSEFGA